MGVLTAADSTALALLCEHTATWFACINQTREEGVIADRSMNPEKQRFGRNPIYEEALKAGQQMERLLIEFGLTPSSRTRVRRA